MDSPRFTRPWLAFAIGVPLAWAILLMFHPGGEGESITYAEVQDKVTPWMVVHLGIGSLAFIVAAIATGIALRRHAGAPLAVPVLLGLSGFLITAHPPPFGPIGLGLFIVAILIFARSQAAARSPASLAQPGAA
jgi:hypothetical protein